MRKGTSCIWWGETPSSRGRSVRGVDGCGRLLRLLALALVLHLAGAALSRAGEDPGSVRVFMSAEGQQDEVATTGNTTAALQAGGVVHIEVWVQDSAASGQILNGFQLYYPTVATLQAGAAGSVGYVDNFSVCSCDSFIINKAHPLYVFKNAYWIKDIPANYDETADIYGALYVTFFPPTGVNLSLPGAVPNPGGPNYLCEFDLSTSPNTRGLFDLNFIFPPESAPTSMLFAGGTFDPFVEFLVDEYQPLTIAVFNCGDGIVDLPEQCDDGALNSDEPGALCRTDCTLGGCGDGIVDFPTGETCDGSAAPGCPFCRPPGGPAACTCCGDGVVQQAAGEDCDDAGGESGDGCSSACTIEPEFGCSGEPSLCVRIPRIPAVSRQGMILLTAVLLAAVLATGPRRRRPRRT